MPEPLDSLIAAVMADDTDGVRDAVAMGADPDGIANGLLERPLHIAARLGLKYVALALLGCGANARLEDGYGANPTDKARLAGFADLAAMLSKAERPDWSSPDIGRPSAHADARRTRHHRPRLL